MLKIWGGRNKALITDCFVEVNADHMGASSGPWLRL